MRCQILDCTLRDGGYINDFAFGHETIRSIVQSLALANLDIIEVGFLRDCIYNPDSTVFTSIELANQVLPLKRGGALYVSMLALGENELPFEKVSARTSNVIDGIRIAFHEDEIDRAFAFADNLRIKGYLIFMQPVGLTSYTDQRLLDLIEKINTFTPFAFYIVDTLGVMLENHLLRYFYILDHNLDQKIHLGFHSHNNLQLSFSHAQALMRLQTKRSIMLDSTVLGMGRGAGNLCTELIASYINNTQEKRYDEQLILDIVDGFILPLQKRYSWGYSIPYYLAATHDCHPNYASYLLNKQMLSMNGIHTLLGRIPFSKKPIFHHEEIEALYKEYQGNFIDDGDAKQKLHKRINQRNILLIGPGGSLRSESIAIAEYISKYKPISISVNFIPDAIDVNYSFFSNAKRFASFCASQQKSGNNFSIISTSNISRSTLMPDYVFDYSSLLNNNSLVFDNSLLMLVKLLLQLGVNTLALAGFDGFVTSAAVSYYKADLETSTDISEQLQITSAIKNELDKFSEICPMVFVTKSVYQKTGL